MKPESNMFFQTIKTNNEQDNSEESLISWSKPWFDVAFIIFMFALTAGEVYGIIKLFQWIF